MAVEEGELSLDSGTDEEGVDVNNNNNTMAPLSIEEQYRRERHARKVKHWKDSPFAVGLTDITWNDESSAGSIAGMTKEDIDPDSAGCLCCSRWCCKRAGRVGNMAILSQTQEWVEEVVIDDDDNETGESLPKTRRYTRPKLVWILGPYWPMLLFVTYPLILGVSGWTLVSVIPHVPFLVQLVWTICTVGLIYALAMTAFRDPGILYRHAAPPAQSENSWRWNDAALTYRPRGAFYDSDCAVVVQDFDHT